jgi:crotonobetainyl-CoA:carnitine CoA-transferase CaiB-like acyl-CoA transferase
MGEHTADAASRDGLDDPAGGADGATTLPLSGVRVLDLCAGPAAMCGRWLADMGADVVWVDAPDGPESSRSRADEPVVSGVSLPFLVRSANKRRVVIDLGTAEGRERLGRLVLSADLLVEDRRPGWLAGIGLDPGRLRAAKPALVVTSITDFGQTGPYRDWAGTDWVHLALSSVLSRSGQPGQPPLMPPGRLAYEGAAAQAAWVSLVALWAARSTGTGDHVDLSVWEATLQGLDPAFGIAGSATGGVPASDLPPGRPDVSFMYPIFGCADGHVRICLLARRQWRAMFGWLGEPAEFAAPRYDSTAVRFAERERLYPLIGALFAGQPRADLVAEGQRRGVPIEGISMPGDVLRSEHFGARGTWSRIRVGGSAGLLADGAVEFDGRRAGYRAPLRDADTTDGFESPGASVAAMPESSGVSGTGPLHGLRVLDLGVIVVGAETGRLFGDLGADVIKIESTAFPDGSRASSRSGQVNASIAWGHRNKRSLGLDLRSPRGKELFIQLAAVSDVVLSNFKPGTMESLGLGYETLREANPGIVMVDSSALGRSGPLSRRMGYGPLVRAATGLTSLWRYPGQPEGFCDAVTVYPDHTAGRIGAVAALARLLRRRADGQGGTVSVAQAEVMFTQFSAEFLHESLVPGSMTAVGNSGEFDAPWGVYPCTGDDQWCVITSRGGADWQLLCEVIDAHDLSADPGLRSAAGRVAQRARIDGRVAAWTGERTPDEVMTTLQAAGVPAAAMLRVNDLRADPQLAGRGFFTIMNQPQIGDIPTENGPAIFDRIPAPALAPAPLQGQHTREIARQLLGLDEAEIGKLLADGILQTDEVT